MVIPTEMEMSESARGEKVLGDLLMTQARGEQKFLFPRAYATQLARELNRHLPSHRFEEEGANPLPLPQHFVTTLYFDTLDEQFFRLSVEAPLQNHKLRIKDYYDRHPDLACVVASAERLLVPSPFLWLEFKRREGTSSFKDRKRVPRAQLSGLLAVLAREQPAASIAFADAWLPESPVRPTVAVNYRRLSWQDARGTLRLTLDLDVAFYEPPSSLGANVDAPLSPAFLGRRVERLDQALLEVKTRGAMPDWLEEMLERGARDTHASESDFSQAVPFSKFRAGREALIRARDNK
jgi:VTC domain